MSGTRFAAPGLYSGTRESFAIAMRSGANVTFGEYRRVRANSWKQLVTGRWLLPVWLGLFLIAGFIPAAAQQTAVPPVTMSLSPETIAMGAFYNGAPIRIHGTMPSGSKVIVVVRGVSKDEMFNKKGRVALIWINTDKVHVTGTPSLFLRFSSEDIHTFLSSDTIDAFVLDELSIKKRMHIRTEQGDPDPQYRELLTNSYLELKKDDGSYRRLADRVQVAETGGGVAQYSLAFNWPKSAPPGSYQVEVYACRDNAIIGRTGSVLRLREVGFPAFMAELAHSHPYGYGLIAVVMAIIAGFGIDAVASRLRGSKKRAASHGAPVLRPEPSAKTMSASAGTKRVNG